jgi:hypothetical protein
MLYVHATAKSKMRNSTIRMKNLFIILFLLFIMTQSSVGQYNEFGLVISGGTGLTRYIGNGEGDNYFNFSNPYQGFQFELTANNHNGFEWIIYGLAHYKSYNYVADSKVPVEFWIPYYTEFIFYQSKKRYPLFVFFGYDYVQMSFPEMEKPDSHYNITFGGGWNIKLSEPLYLQFKLKPYFIIDNSIGQWFGFNALINLHLGIKKKV